MGVLSRGPVNNTTHNRQSGTLRILGIDPGYERCGFAVLDKHSRARETLVYSSCFKTPATLPFAERLVLIGRECARLMAEYTPTLCAIEKLYFTSNQKTAMQVAEVRGALLYLTRNAGLALCEYTPNEVKVAVAGDGRADKQQITFMVPRLVSMPDQVRYDDEYDAIAVALTASAHVRDS